MNKQREKKVDPEDASPDPTAGDSSGDRAWPEQPRAHGRPGSGEHDSDHGQDCHGSGWHGDRHRLGRGPRPTSGRASRTETKVLKALRWNPRGLGRRDLRAVARIRNAVMGQALRALVEHGEVSTMT